MEYTSFIKDTLDLTKSISSRSWELANGTVVIQHIRGVVEVVPPKCSNRAIILSSGIHGNETSPIEILDSILIDIQSGKLCLNDPCLFIYGHPQATLEEQRFLDTNLNRLFTGYHNDNSEIKEVALANSLMNQVDTFYQKHNADDMWHLDLHCAIRRSMHYTFAIHPFNRHYQRSDKLLSFLNDSQIEACLFSEAPASTFSWYSAEYHGAHAATIELGKVAKLGENDFEPLADFIHGLRGFISASETATNELNVDIDKHSSSLIEYQVTRSIIKKSNDFEFHFPVDLANFTLFNEGQLLSSEGSQKCYANGGGENVVFPNSNVEIGHRACLLVQKIDN
ncbi:succinylglutamate desuccinylase [Aliivibrio logei]|uniref:Succinylglutamate desuccinylase n=1 Tax=Aliivibrio logei TaxID=688 RepID=A0A1B9P0P9_ALILO|nr:succinylglutamate desuccinylase [Aliivibrio logei]OCH21930.1 succinylglutamate desuccinylase [Aliivibrio logei]